MTLFVVLCMAAETFLIYALVNFGRESRGNRQALARVTVIREIPKTRGAKVTPITAGRRTPTQNASGRKAS
jgi:hypothetical protein